MEKPPAKRPAMTGFTSSSRSTRSPMTMVSLPRSLNAAYEPNAKAGATGAHHPDGWLPALDDQAQDQGGDGEGEHPAASVGPAQPNEWRVDVEPRGIRGIEGQIPGDEPDARAQATDYESAGAPGPRPQRE